MNVFEFKFLNANLNWKGNCMDIFPTATEYNITEFRMLEKVNYRKMK